MASSPSGHLAHLECSVCNALFDADQLHNLCTHCGAPLLARYDLGSLGEDFSPELVGGRPRGLWRWAELLPLRDPAHRVTLGEGDTPLLRLERLGAQLGCSRLYIKDEALNPTGTFKARGLAMAVSRAVELGVSEFVIPTAGNAGGALAAYAAKAGLPAHVFMPKDAPQVNQTEVRLSGADLHLVDGLIDEAGRLAGQGAAAQGWFEVSTFKEPYRVEGKKTLGFEIAEAFAYDLPEVIIYPTGGGTGLVGMWKAFEELAALGWLNGKRPRMVCVQAAGCAPIVRAFEAREQRAQPWEGANTIASGLRVPKLLADRLILTVLRQSSGTAVAVSDEEIIAAQKKLAACEGILPAPESAATLAGLHRLLDTGWLDKDERILLFNTGSGLKYL